jgi:UDPglucose 6-dehydrogenase
VKEREYMTSVSIIGAGTVGRAVGIGLIKHGCKVIFYDVDDRKLRELKASGYNVSNDISTAINNSEISFICVPTPTSMGRFDFRYVEKAARDIGSALSKMGNYHLVVVKSTVLPFTTRTRIIPILENCSGLKTGEDFGVCVNPEFLRQATALSDFLNPTRIVIGELDERSGKKLESLYRPFNAPIFRTTLETAEMIKYVANLFLATKISFFNEIYIICKKFGLDPHLISEVVALDPRIGRYGIYGGRPFGGDCLPKDLEAFISFARENGLNPEILEAVLHVNELLKKRLNNFPEQDDG